MYIKCLKLSINETKGVFKILDLGLCCLRIYILFIKLSWLRACPNEVGVFRTFFKVL